MTNTKPNDCASGRVRPDGMPAWDWATVDDALGHINGAIATLNALRENFSRSLYVTDDRVIAMNFLVCRLYSANKAARAAFYDGKSLRRGMDQITLECNLAEIRSYAEMLRQIFENRFEADEPTDVELSGLIQDLAVDVLYHHRAAHKAFHGEEYQP